MLKIEKPISILFMLAVVDNVAGEYRVDGEIENEMVVIDVRSKAIQKRLTKLNRYFKPRLN